MATPRRIRPKVETHAWCVELPRLLGPWRLEWHLATAAAAHAFSGPAVFWSLGAAREFRTKLTQYVDPNGRRPFRRARVRRVRLVAWGCAV